MKDIKEATPSLHSLASSEVSTSTMTSVHQRSTPKIAAVIIVAFLVVAVLVAVTVYLINKDNFHASSIMDNSVHTAQGQVKQPPESDIWSNIWPDVRDRDDRLGLPQSKNMPLTYYEHDFPAQTLRDPLLNKAFGDTTTTSTSTTTATTSHASINEDLPQDIGELSFTDISQMVDSGMFGLESEPPEEAQEAQEEPLLEQEELEVKDSVRFVEEDHDDDIEDLFFDPALEQDMLPFGLKDFVDPFRDPVVNRLYGGEHTFRRGRPTIAASGTRLIPDHVFQAPMLRINNRQGEDHLGSLNQLPNRYRARQPIVKEDVPEADEEEEEEEDAAALDSEPPPSVASLPVHDQLQSLDRRPGRPLFHHQGPFPTPPPPSEKPVNLDWTSDQSRPFLATSDDFEQHFGGDLFGKVNQLITLASEEMEVMRHIARNITDRGREITLWEVMDTVNMSTKEKPDSVLSGLMQRFYDKYLAQADGSADAFETSVTSNQDPDQHKSLSSLVFLSLGIFLLNSISDVMSKDVTLSARSMGRMNSPLKLLMSDEPEILSMYTSDQSLSRKINPAGDWPGVNQYLRLVLNLMDVYSRNNPAEIDCLWSVYCNEINEQAAQGGMPSSTARINSVGLKLLLKMLPSSEVVPAIFQTLMKWKDLPCLEMFPQCPENEILSS